MARKFTKVKENAFDNLQMNAGLLLNNFDPTGVTAIADDDIISATTGGINAVATPTYVDLADGVDNAPLNMKEFKEIESWECTLSTTLIGAEVNVVALMLGASDISADKITPRMTLALTDFSDVWWVGDKADGGMVAIHLMNALSSDGFNLQTNDKGKGEFSLTLMGHVSIESQSVVPMEFYVTNNAE